MSVLVKWLVEMTRDYFKDEMKNLMKETHPTILPAQREDKSLSKVTSPKNGRVFRPLKTQKTLADSSVEKDLFETQQSPMNQVRKNAKIHMENFNILR